MTQFAEHVTVLQGLSNLTGSKLLQDKVLNHPKMSVLCNAKVKAFVANDSGKLESIKLEHEGEGCRA